MIGTGLRELESEYSGADYSRLQKFSFLKENYYLSNKNLEEQDFAFQMFGKTKWGCGFSKSLKRQNRRKRPATAVERSPDFLNGRAVQTVRAQAL